MSRGETALPHRVATSAKQLARSTFAGIERELECSDSGKQAGGPSRRQTSSSSGSSSRDATVPRRPELASRENSFRSQVSADALKAVEEHFDLFREHQSFEPWDSLRDATLSSSFRDLDQSYENSDYQDDLHTHPHDASCTHTSSQLNGLSSSVDNIDAEQLKSSTEANLDHARSSALRRLQQVGEHMQRNLAMQEVFRQELGSESLSTTHSGTSQYQQDQQRPLSHQSPHPSEPGLSPQTNPIHQVHHTPQPAPPTQSPRENEEESAPETPFHCPYYACHQNLLHYLASPDRRSCVHVGCGFQAESSEGWKEHIALSHHDLQGSRWTAG